MLVLTLSLKDISGLNIHLCSSSKDFTFITPLDAHHSDRITFKII